MPYKLHFISLGCAKNVVNCEQMMALCREAGHTLTDAPEGADVAQVLRDLRSGKPLSELWSELEYDPDNAY